MILTSDKKSSYEITNCTCSCPTGTGWSAACKHLGALCYSLEYFSITGKPQEFVSCTSEPVNWKKPRAGRSIEYISIFDITKKKPNFTVDEEFSDSTVDKLINYNINCPLTLSRRVNFNDYLNDHTYDKESQQRVVKEDKIYNKDLEIIILNANNLKCMNKLDAILPAQQRCINAYNNIIITNTLEVCCNTKDNKNIWHKERIFRITSSRCYSLYTYQKDNWQIKSEKYFWAKAFSNRFIEYGIQTESEARNVYKCRLQYNVIETGLIICKRYPWLACSPDGVILKNGEPHKLLEIKCPVIVKEKSAIEFIKYADYLVIENYRLSLKKRHAYYAQVKLDMAILNLKECDVIVYSSFSKTFLNITVYFDS